TPAAEAPAAKAPGAEAPVAETPAAEAPAAEPPTAEAPTAETPAAEAPTAEAPAADVQKPKSKGVSSAYKQIEEVVSSIATEIKEVVFDDENVGSDKNIARKKLNNIKDVFDKVDRGIKEVRSNVEKKREDVLIGTLIDRSMKKEILDEFAPDYTMPGMVTDTEKGKKTQRRNEYDYLLNVRYTERQHVSYKEDDFKKLAEDAFGESEIVGTLMKKPEDFVDYFINEANILYGFFKDAKLGRRMEEAASIYALIIQKLVEKEHMLETYKRPYDHSLYYFVMNLGENLRNNTCILHKEIIANETKSGEPSAVQQVYESVIVDEETEEEAVAEAEKSKEKEETEDKKKKAGKKLKQGERRDPLYYTGKDTKLNEDRSVENRFYGSSEIEKIIFQFDVIDGVRISKKSSEKLLAIQSLDSVMDYNRELTSLRFMLGKVKANDGKHESLVLTDVIAMGGPEPNYKTEAGKTEKEEPVKPERIVSEEISEKIALMSFEDLKERFLKKEEGADIPEEAKVVFAKFLMYKFSTVTGEEEKKGLADSVSGDEEVMGILEKYYARSVKTEDGKKHLNIEGIGVNKWKVAKEEDVKGDINSYMYRISLSLQNRMDESREARESRFENLSVEIPLNTYTGETTVVVPTEI
nr:hypothetical protein [Lachnospiraceae bacterium]